jgi:hypothetical protein
LHSLKWIRIDCPSKRLLWGKGEDGLKVLTISRALEANLMGELRKAEGGSANLIVRRVRQ